MDARIAFSDSNDLSGSSTVSCAANTESFSPEAITSEIASLRRLSDSLQSIFDASSLDSAFADARISVDGGREDLAKEFDVSFDALVVVLGYLYSGRVRSLPEGVCVCVDDDCSHAACRPAVDFMVEVLYAAFAFQVSELVSLYQRRLLDILGKIASDDIVPCPNILSNKLSMHAWKLGCTALQAVGRFPDKHVKRIHRALDSDDVELVRMLLKEGHTSLDDACAIHYAVAYCDAKTTMELLDLALADVNHRNPRGYTVLHVAAMRKEPKIIVSLLTKGARPGDLTLDGRKALQISKRLTRAVDYHKSMEEGKASPKDRLCIEILEQAERRDPLPGEASVSLAMAGDDLRMKLLYLETRVGLAKVLFPMEAKVAMDIAQVDGTSEFPLSVINLKNLTVAQSTTMDLNEAPFKIKEEHLNRHRALSRTVELGKRFFPRCSEVLNKIMDADDLSELAYLENENAEDRKLKKQRYTELQEVLSNAFNKDKEEFDRSKNISSSSSSTSMSLGRPSGKLTFKK
ncbi:regulatory protein [Actinidia rufa]|uniref:Regulatory protein n=1 Tax=Actinidia rufa TaxID=165716 RepID=A0A7J0E480_9ERIC|nr:regulatory protein [Actinidia rufa]